MILGHRFGKTERACDLRHGEVVAFEKKLEDPIQRRVEREPHMSEVIITAAAWVRDEPKVTKTVEGEPVAFAWRILAEASVTDTEGGPVSKLPKGAWRVHVTDGSGVTFLLAFSVAEIVPIINQPTQLGFYLLTLAEFPTSAWVAPTACGIAIRGYRGPKKPQTHVRGQVVVPIELAGPTAVHMLATPGF
jgi:hypothetical protein